MRFSPEEFVNTRIYGKAKVTLHKEFPSVEAVQIAFLDGSGKYVAKGKDNYPDQVKNGDFNVAIDPLDDGLCEFVGFTPCGERLPVRFIEFTHKDGEQPCPKEKSPKNPKFKPYETFTPIVEVFEGEYKGLRLYPQLRYLFCVDDDTGEAMYSFQHLEYNGAKTHGGRLHTFLYSAGMTDADRLKYSDNLLPVIQRLLISRNTPFIMETNTDGWPHWFYPYVSANADFDVPNVDSVSAPVEDGFTETSTEPPWPVEAETSDEKEIDLESDDAWAE